MTVQTYFNEIKEFLDRYAIEGNVHKLRYAYHFQSEAHALIFRCDNAAHKPELPYKTHKHLPGKIIKAPPPTLADVIEEILASRIIG